MVDYLTRNDWGARAAKGGPGKLNPAKVRGVAIHWPGTEGKPIHSQASVASALRGWQTFHMDDRGWSDIAYQVAVDQAGRAWTLRGFRTKSAANGDTEVNEEYGAILLVLVEDEKPTDAMKATVRAVVSDFRLLYGARAAEIRPHSAVRPEPTDCPGREATRCIVNGDFEPWAQHPNPPEDDMWDPAKAELIEKRYVLADQLWRAQTAAEQAASNALAAHLIAAGADVAHVVEEVGKIWAPIQRTLGAQLESL